ncbi:hypothetical protein ACVWYN_000416 [Pedobacter sp. UYP24]
MSYFKFHLKQKPLIKGVPIILFLFFFYFLFWWLYKLDILPGLHGDEAWFGLRAYYFGQKGTSELYSMNNYTGVLEPLIICSIFKAFKIGVFQLRLAGVIFNSIGICIIGFALLKKKKLRVLLLFLMIIGQSSLYLLMPRIAWEVNTLTLFFISLLVLSSIKILESQDAKPIWTLLFLITNILGTYNHIIFSCISVASLVGLTCWSLYLGNSHYKKIILLLTINFLNVFIVFLSMHYKLDVVFMIKSPTVILCLALILVIEEFIILKKIPKTEFSSPIIVKPALIYSFLFFAFANFVAYHGIAFFQTVSNYYLLIRFYSYKPEIVSQFLSFLCAFIFIGYIIYFLLDDVKRKDTSAIFAFILIAYMGIFPFYTTNCSFRYYLSIFLLFSLYIALKISKNLILCIPVIFSMVISCIIINLNLITIFYSKRPVMAMNFIIGNGKKETSAHFIPNKPIIDFLRTNHVGKIIYVSDRYFIEQPVLFYRLAEPWKSTKEKEAIILYDFENFGSGYFYSLKY